MNMRPFPAPRPFNPLDFPGFTVEHIEADWEDVGGPENGPCIQGHPAYDYWTLGDRYVAVEDGMIVDEGTVPDYPDDIPF